VMFAAQLHPPHCGPLLLPGLELADLGAVGEVIQVLRRAENGGLPIESEQSVGRRLGNEARGGVLDPRVGVEGEEVAAPRQKA